MGPQGKPKIGVCYLHRRRRDLDFASKHMTGCGKTQSSSFLIQLYFMAFYRSTLANINVGAKIYVSERHYCYS